MMRESVISYNSQKSTFIVCLVFFVCPFLALPLVLVEIYNEKRYAFYLLAIFTGLLSMYYFPQGDQYRYWLDLHNFKYETWNEAFDFSQILIYRNLNLINIFIFICSRCDFITLEIIRFILVSGCAGLMFSMYLEISAKYKNLGYNRNKRFCMFIALALSIPYYGISYGFRTGVGSCFITYAVYCLFNHKQKTGILFMILAGLTHYFYIAYGLVLICSVRIKKS